jgi:hypothetical protein
MEEPMSARTLLLTVLVAFFGMGLTPSLAAQAPDTATVTLDATDGEGMPPAKFVAWFTEHAARPVTIAPPAKQVLENATTRIRFDRPVRIPGNTVLRFARQVLFPHDLTLVEMGESTAAYYLVESLRTPTVLPHHRRTVTVAELASLCNDYVMVSCTVPLEHARVQQIQAQIQRLCSQPPRPYGGSIVPVPSRNEFVIVDFAPAAFNVVEAVRALDVEPDAKALPAFPSPRMALELALLNKRVAALEAALEERKTSDR